MTKKTIGTLLWTAGHIVNLLTLLAAAVYLFGTVAWMHAPLLGVLPVLAAMVVLPLGLAWLCRRLGGRLRAEALVPAPVPAGLPARVKKWWWAGLGIALLATFMVVRTGWQAAACSVERSRNWDAAQLQARREGFERVCPGDLGRFDVFFLPDAIATRALAFTPVDLTHTPFSKLESLGARAETVVDVRSRLYRGFRLPDGHRVTLFEQDMAADGSTSWRAPADEPERINGLPARLVVMEEPSGKAVSMLSWMEGRRDYQLWIDANVVRVPLRERLFALAASLPRSVPACPNEVLPKPAQRGPDGMPLDDPLPQVLTSEDAKAFNNRRPCK